MKKIILAMGLMTSVNALAQSTSVSGRLTITPVIGYERVQKFYPTAHMDSRTSIGVIAIYRFPVLALETEYSHSTGDAAAVDGTKYEDTEDKLRVGVRGNLNNNQYLGSYLRGGAQATKTKLTTTTPSQTSSSSTTTKVHPYVGAGLDIRVSTYISLTADMTVVYAPTDDPNLSDFEVQPSLGVSLKF